MEHIAGAAQLSYLVTTGATSWGEYCLEFLMLALSRNIIGGVLLVAVLSQAQVMSRAQRVVASTGDSQG